MKIKLPGITLYALKGATAYEASIIIRGHEFHGRIPQRQFLFVGSPGLLAHIDPEGVWTHRKEIQLLPWRLVKRLRRYAYRSPEEWQRQKPHHEFFDRVFNR